MVAAATSPGVADPASSKLQSELRNKWKRIIRKAPLAERLSWLKSPEGLTAFGARARFDRVKSIEHELQELLAAVPSSTWADLAENRGDEFPPPGMVLGKGRVRIGDQTIATRRFTPSIAVQIEDLLDRMDVIAARFYLYPPSPSALVIGRVGLMLGREQGGTVRSGGRSQGGRKQGRPINDIAYGDRGVQYFRGGIARD